MLSPLYDKGIGRDGCFFCPNAGKKEREMLKTEYPEMVQRIYDMIGKTNCQAVFRCKNRNNWIKDYIENDGVLEKQTKEEKPVEGQISLFEWMEGD